MGGWNTHEYRIAMERSYEAIRAKHPSLVTVRFECYSGWFGIIEGYFDDVARVMEQHPGSTFSLWQVKEKFAGLRLYAGTSSDISDGVRAAYDEASAQAGETCEVCGDTGLLRKRGGWYATRCVEHADGATPVSDAGDQRVDGTPVSQKARIDRDR